MSKQCSWSEFRDGRIGPPCEASVMPKPIGAISNEFCAQHDEEYRKRADEISRQGRKHTKNMMEWRRKNPGRWYAA